MYAWKHEVNQGGTVRMPAIGKCSAIRSFAPSCKHGSTRVWRPYAPNMAGLDAGQL